MRPTPAELSEHLKFTSLYRYYGWSTVLRNQFQEPFDKIIETDDLEGGLAEWMGPLSLGKGTIFLSYWYAALYVVVEGWGDLGLTDPAIDTLLAADYKGKMRRHRNATCHYQEGFFVDKWNEFENTPGSAEWIRQLDREFGRYFMERTKAYAKQFRP
jgi:hypothetical protein